MDLTRLTFCEIRDWRNGYTGIELVEELGVTKTNFLVKLTS